MPDFFETIIKVEDAHYDEESQSILIFIVVVVTSEKKILVEPKESFHYKDGKTGDFPDRLMQQRVGYWLNLRGKPRKWRLYTDVDTKEMTANTVKGIAERVGVQMGEISSIISEEDRIVGRKKEDLLKIEEKKKFQDEAIQKLRSKLKENKNET